MFHSNVSQPKTNVHSLMWSPPISVIKSWVIFYCILVRKFSIWKKQIFKVRFSPKIKFGRFIENSLCTWLILIFAALNKWSKIMSWIDHDQLNYDSDFLFQQNPLRINISQRLAFSFAFDRILNKNFKIFWRGLKN